MDAIRKKMTSLRSETDNLISQIRGFEEDANQANLIAERCDCDIRDVSKKISLLETDYDATNDKLGRNQFAIL